MTKIEWADVTWNPVTGCSPVSESCENCYAKRMANRLRGRFGYPKDEPFRVTYHTDRLLQPVNWHKSRRIFVCSMGDIFHEDLADHQINAIFHMMTHPMGGMNHHTYLILTKRPERILNSKWSPEWKHIWLGVTAENQKRADERIPILLQIPAAVRFVSIEPMLSDLWIKDYLPKVGERLAEFCESRECAGCDVGDEPCEEYVEWKNEPTLDWVITGGETGPGARPMHPFWTHNIMDQCEAAGVPMFFKSWGEWHFDRGQKKHGKPYQKHIFDDGLITRRVGKKAAGRLLDGREHNEFPSPNRSPLVLAP